MPMSLLRVENFSVTADDINGEKRILEHIDLEIPDFSITALVGGSGSGKTTTGLAILRLLPSALRIRTGKIIFNNKILTDASPKEMREMRGKEISMIFQEPLSAFNPVFSIGYQIEEVLEVHTGLNRRQRQKRVLELLNITGLPDPGRIAENYPHQLSGGMRQRAMIAQAIAADPRLIIADEPTSSLDVTLQAHMIELFKKLKDELKLSILLITHDLGMVEHMADNIAVMTDGKIVEKGATHEILRNPQHRYTKELMEALC
jgi:ABC-type dipeptide/oligopeptide/nickel transport system ATPase component